MSSTVQIGNDKASADRFIEAIMQIITAPDVDQLTKHKALDTLAEAGQVAHSSLSHCIIVGGERQEELSAVLKKLARLVLAEDHVGVEVKSNPVFESQGLGDEEG